MRNLQKTLAFFGILVTATIGQLVGCSTDAENCELNYETCTSASSSGSSGVVTPPPECADSPSINREVIRSDCAYFVGGSKANDSNTGGETDPFATLGAALDAAKKQKARVYLCGSVAERVDIPAGVSVFGGFDCLADEWKYDAAQPATISPAAPDADAAFQASVRITGGKTSIEDVNIIAEDAKIAGGSSIAVIVSDGTVNFVRAKLTAGDGKDGAEGETLPDDMTLAGVTGNAGKEICSAGATNPGGNEVMKTCADGTISTGGKGGNGGLIDVVNMNKELAGEDGADGIPALAAGAKGLGEPETGSWSCAVDGDAQSGEQGSRGTHGNGAQSNGEISATGYLSVNGSGGTNGTPGQGGGGGGGARGKANICGSTRAGASGGGGGSGGCGGKGGGGGQGGGASIALVSLNATIVITECTLTPSLGGNGGNGGTGQTGGTGAAGAKGGAKSGSSNSGCSGGDGGDGGGGGPGGGGAGGPAAGIAFVGVAPEVAANSTIGKGMPGNGGKGGENNIANNPGSNGASDTILKF